MFRTAVATASPTNSTDALAVMASPAVIATGLVLLLLLAVLSIYMRTQPSSVPGEFMTAPTCTTEVYLNLPGELI